MSSSTLRSSTVGTPKPINKFPALSSGCSCRTARLDAVQVLAAASRGIRQKGDREEPPDIGQRKLKLRSNRNLIGVEGFVGSTGENKTAVR